MPDDLHPAPILQLLDDQAIDRDTPDIFNIPARHGLPVGDDGQGFQRGTRVAGGLLWMQPVQKLPHLGTALKPPS